VQDLYKPEHSMRARSNGQRPNRRQHRNALWHSRKKASGQGSAVGTLNKLRDRSILAKVCEVRVELRLLVLINPVRCDNGESSQSLVSFVLPSKRQDWVDTARSAESVAAISMPGPPEERRRRMLVTTRALVPATT